LGEEPGREELTFPGGQVGYKKKKELNDHTCRELEWSVPMLHSSGERD